MPTWLLDDDPFYGLREYFTPKPGGGFVIETVQDVEPILERNKAIQNSASGYTPSKDMKFVATIPPIIELKWRNELGIDINNKNHWPAVKRLLNSSEWRYLRTGLGKI